MKSGWYLNGRDVDTNLSFSILHCSVTCIEATCIDLVYCETADKYIGAKLKQKETGQKFEVCLILIWLMIFPNIININLSRFLET